MLYLIIFRPEAHILLAQQGLLHLADKVGTACLEDHPVEGMACLVAVSRLDLEEGSPCPLVVGTACLVEAKLDVQEGSQDEAEGRHSFRMVVVAQRLDDLYVSEAQVSNCS